MFLFALVSWWEQYPDTAIPGTDCSDHRNRESFGLSCVGWPTTVSRFCFILYKFLRQEIHSWWRSPAWDETMARQWEGVDEDAAVGPRFGQDPPPSFSAPTPACTCRQWKRDLRMWQATGCITWSRVQAHVLAGEVAHRQTRKSSPGFFVLFRCRVLVLSMVMRRS